MEESRDWSSFRPETDFYEFSNLEMEGCWFQLSQENTFVPKLE